MIEVRHVEEDEDLRNCDNKVLRIGRGTETREADHPAAFEIRIEEKLIYLCSFDAQLLSRMLEREILS